MISKDCKCKNTYTRDCDCEETVWNQGVGSLTGQGSSSISKIEEEKSVNSQSTNPSTSNQGVSNVTQVINERTI